MANELQKFDTNTEDNDADIHENWFGDSGASVNNSNDDAGIFNTRPCDFGITIGDRV